MLPVIILSTSNNPCDVVPCRNLGASGFLSKARDLQGYEALASEMATANTPGAMLGIFSHWR